MADPVDTLAQALAAYEGWFGTWPRRTRVWKGGVIDDFVAAARAVVEADRQNDLGDDRVAVVSSEVLGRIDWYVECLRKAWAGRVVRDLDEAQSGYNAAMSELAALATTDAVAAVSEEVVPLDTDPAARLYRDELLRLLEPAEADQKYVDCCWTWVNEPNCVRRPMFRLATPIGHMNFCPEHISYMLAELPAEWVSGWAFREPVEAEGGSDDVPF